jgi:HlyD family secretion protein
MKLPAVSKKALLVLVAAGLLGAFALGMRPSPVAVDTARVVRGPLRVTLDDEGVTRVRERYLVSAPVAARLLRVELEPGTPVHAGDPVATLRPMAPNLLDARSRGAAEARVQAAAAGLGRTQADRARAIAELAYAESEEQRAGALGRDGLLSAQTVEVTTLSAATRRQAVAAADYAVAAAEAELRVARAALLEASGGSEATAGPLTLTSPVDGVVLRRLHESEAVVPAGEPLLEIGNPADLEVVADLLSRDAAQVRPGQRVEIVEWGGSAPLIGEVTRIEPAGRTKVSALGVEEQRVDVVIALATGDAGSPAALGDGFRVEVRIVLWEGTDQLLVPTSAIFRSASPVGGASPASTGDWATFVLVDGRLAERRLEIGRQDGLAAQVISGLAAGEEVVVHPGADVRTGVAARVRGAG